MRKILLIFFVLGTFFILAACEDKGREDAENNEAANKEESDLIEKTGVIGEEISFEDLSLTVNSMEEKSSGPHQFDAPGEGNVFIIVDITLKNTGEEKMDYAARPHFYLEDSSGALLDVYGDEVDRIGSADTSVDGDTKINHFNELEPEEEVSGTQAFRVPEDYGELFLIFERWDERRPPDLQIGEIIVSLNEINEDSTVEKETEDEKESPEGFAEDQKRTIGETGIHDSRLYTQEITINDVRTEDTYEVNYLKAGEEVRDDRPLEHDYFIVFELTMKNISDEPIDSHDLAPVDVIDDDGELYARHNHFCFWPDGLDLSVVGYADKEEMEPGDSFTGELVCDVNESSHYELRYGWESDYLSNEIFWEIDMDEFGKELNK
ncbi:DUF4352 domain-containing protein [Oceanobacillus jeddahense]|uniref:DUF4352 domain-containing protein n=1 Tax=Oceanobacillus jeddahense TaxID=1462527 RepID=A0ABY5JM88_9BACI|nr:DUF4352 domain-containing protein [Oceanobacillus jeddahense]UUI01410.1 DUF4352 domain-containing protein [Oceanobacillus jeddahense]